MKPAALGTMVGLIIGCAAMLWSCRTDRVSDNYTCSENTDCDPDRVCNMGYCVVGTRPVDAKIADAAECPAICKTTCNLQTLECPITGTGSGTITCPPGWKCNIGCPTPGACGAISCTGALSCDIMCAADNACLAITCTGANCNVNCTGQNACGNITCTTGDCTATCAGSDACGNLSCTSGDCTQDCTGGGGQRVCGSLSCTTGACKRTCTGANACNATMTCNGGACTEVCSGGMNACGAATCGTGKCTATCMGADSACGNVSCASSCGCQVNCDTTAGNTCPATMSCRTTGNGANQKYCSVTGLTGGACSFAGSGGIAGCNTCP